MIPLPKEITAGNQDHQQIVNSPLKILVIPPSYFAQNRTIGGGERYALAFARALAERADITLALFDRTPSCSTSGPLRIEVFPVRHFSQRFGFPISLAGAKRLAQYDLVHIFVFPTPLADWFLLRSRWTRQKIVLTDVGGSGACWSARLRLIHPKFDLNRWAHGLAHLSEYAAGFYRGWKAPQTVLYGGANLDWFAPGPPGNDRYALFVGRLLPHKGVLELIEAMPSEGELRIVGRPYDANYFQRLKEAAKGKRVTFHLEANEEELRQLYQRALFVLQPSLPSKQGQDKSELLGLVALEAMACGKPVIVTRTGSLPELVRANETGFIVPAENPAAWREKIAWMFAHPESAAALGTAARRHVDNRFTWMKTADRALDLYRELVVRR